jgi:hypothetical protein
MLAGTAAVAGGVLLWAMAAYATGRELSPLAMMVGIAVGAAITRTGNGPGPRLRALGAVLAFAGCADGTLAAMIAVLVGRYGFRPGIIVDHLNVMLGDYPRTAGCPGLALWAVAAAAAYAPRRRAGRPVPRERQQHSAASSLTAPRPGRPPELAPFLDAARGARSGAGNLPRRSRE